MVLSLRNQWVVEVLAKVADHECCAYCYFGYVKRYLDPADRQALYQCTKNCQCEGKISAGVALESLEEIPVKESK